MKEMLSIIYITTVNTKKKIMHEKLPIIFLCLYYTSIRTVESNDISNKMFTNFNDFIIWHDLLDYSNFNMIRKIIDNSHLHILPSPNILQSKEVSCAACSQGKLIIKPSTVKVIIEFHAFNVYRVIYVDPLNIIRTRHKFLQDANIYVYYQLPTWILRDCCLI